MKNKTKKKKKNKTHHSGSKEVPKKKRNLRYEWFYPLSCKNGQFQILTACHATRHHFFMKCFIGVRHGLFTQRIDSANDRRAKSAIEIQLLTFVFCAKLPLKFIMSLPKPIVEVALRQYCAKQLYRMKFSSIVS